MILDTPRSGKRGETTLRVVTRMGGWGWLEDIATSKLSLNGYAHIVERQVKRTFGEGC